MNQFKNSKTFNAIKHFFCQPLPCAILAVVGWIVCTNIIGAGILCAKSFLGDAANNIENMLHICLITIYALWIKKRLGNSFEIGIRFDNLGKALIMCLTSFAIVVFNASESIRFFCTTPMELSAGEFLSALFDQILSGLTPGITEEFMCRVMLMGIIMHLAMGKKHRLALAVGVSSCIFGLLHFMNIITGAPVMRTVLQVLYASAIGLMFAAIYARTRNIIATMIAHSLIDIAANFHYNFYPELSSVSQEIAQGVSMNEVVVDLTIIILCLGIGFYLLRPSKHHEIEALWGSLAAAEEPDEAVTL